MAITCHSQSLAPVKLRVLRADGGYFRTNISADNSCLTQTKPVLQLVQCGVFATGQPRLLPMEMRQPRKRVMLEQAAPREGYSAMYVRGTRRKQAKIDEKEEVTSDFGHPP